MDATVRSQASRRLSYVAGHVAGIKKMIEADRYCIDVLKQSHAVRKALEKMESMILESHLRTCVVQGISGKDGTQVIDELLVLYRQSNR